MWSTEETQLNTSLTLKWCWTCFPLIFEGLDIEPGARCRVWDPGPGARPAPRHHLLFKWIIAVFRYCGGGLTPENAQKYSQIRSAQEGDRQDVLIALFIFGSKYQITLGGEVELKWFKVFTKIEKDSIDKQDCLIKIMFKMHLLQLKVSIREFWLDAEIKIGKELNYLGTIILMICPQSLIAFIQLDSMSLACLISSFIPSPPSNLILSSFYNKLKSFVAYKLTVSHLSRVGSCPADVNIMSI